MTIKEKKEHSRSLRYTTTVKDFIEKQPGDGFNEKFENMVLYCMKEKPKIEKEIKEKEKRLKELNEKLAKMQSLVRDCESLKYNIESILKNSKKLAEAQI